MSSPKERAFIKKYIDSFNPISPSQKLMLYLDTITLPKSGYLNTSTRGKKLIDLEQDQIEYLSNRCKQCPSDMKLVSKVLYYIKWYEELLESSDEEDKQLYEEIFREDFSSYNIDFNSIFNQESDRGTNTSENSNSVDPDVINDNVKTTADNITESTAPTVVRKVPEKVCEHCGHRYKGGFGTRCPICNDKGL